MQSARIFLLLGAANAGLAVLLGAFAAHSLKERLPAELLAIYQTGIQYHFYHALGMLIIGILMLNLPVTPLLRTAGWLMLAGILLFSGSLYLISIFQLQWIGMATPLGGLAFIISWVLLFACIIRTTFV